jgi:long-chain acyl-CoA synthetase
MNAVDYLMNDHNRAAAGEPVLLTLASEHSYGELRRASDAVADFLIASGLRKGDRILLLSDNSIFWIACYFGTLRAGLVSVPLSPGTGSEDLRFICESCGIRLAFIQGKLSRDQWQALANDCRIVLEGSSRPPEELKLESIPFSDVLASPTSNNHWPEIDEKRDMAAIMFTSGSTGKPRGVMVSHGNIVANTSSIVEYMELTSHDRSMVVLPFFYCFGTSLLHTHLRVGGSLVIDPRFMFPDKVLVRMQETNCTGFAGVPSHYQMLLRKSSFKKMQFPSLRYLQQAGGKLSDSLIRELRDAAPATKVFVMYGQTEATARLSYLPPALLDRKLGSIGRGIPGTRLRVVDGNGKDVLPGQLGEIVAAGNNIALGYWGNGEEDKATFRDGVLYTGDLATVDDDGFIFIMDRSKDILKCGGKRSPCKEVEDALLEFDDLVEAAVIGVPDELLGEAVKAFVVPKKNGIGLIERLQAFCGRRLPSHLMPKEIVVLEALPKNSAGKVLKPALRALKSADFVCQ